MPPAPLLRASSRAIRSCVPLPRPVAHTAREAADYPSLIRPIPKPSLACTTNEPSPPPHHWTLFGAPIELPDHSAVASSEKVCCTCSLPLVSPHKAPNRAVGPLLGSSQFHASQLPVGSIAVTRTIRVGSRCGGGCSPRWSELNLPDDATAVRRPNSRSHDDIPG